MGTSSWPGHVRLTSALWPGFFHVSRKLRSLASGIGVLLAGDRSLRFRCGLPMTQ